MLTLFISSFRIEFIITFDATIATCMIYQNDCSTSSRSNNNTTRGRLWNRPTTSGTPSETYLDLIDGNQSQIGTPRELSHLDRETIGNNLTSAGSPSGTYLPSGWPMENPISANQTEINNALWQINKLQTYDKQACSSSSRRNNNTEIGQPRNRPTTSGTPLGTYLESVDGN